MNECSCGSHSQLTNKVWSPHPIHAEKWLLIQDYISQTPLHLGGTMTGLRKWNVKISHACQFQAEVDKYQSPSFSLCTRSLLPVHGLDNSGVSSRPQNRGAIR